MKTMKIAIGADHAGFKMKEHIKAYLTGEGHEVKDFGTYSEESVDYPDFGHPVATEVQEARADLGVVLCGSGNGISMAVNKHKGIRCAICWNVELAELARQHNNANVLSLPSRFISDEESKEITKAFLHTGFEGGRHARRVDKISASC